MTYAEATLATGPSLPRLSKMFDAALRAQPECSLGHRMRLALIPWAEAGKSPLPPSEHVFDIGH